MGHRIETIRVELEPDTFNELEKWSDAEGKSKRRHVSILLRKLANLRKKNPAALAELGLLDHEAMAAAGH